MARNARVAHIDGSSASGTPHGVLIETSDDAVLITITGADGKKRHATSAIRTSDSLVGLLDLITALQGVARAKGGLA